MKQKQERTQHTEIAAVVILLMTVNTTAMAVSTDTTPDPFTFIDQVDVSAGMPVVSAPVIITGIDTAANATVSGGDYSVGCTGNWTSANGTIVNGQSVCVRHSASLASLVTTSTTLTVGGVSDTFSSTTESLVIVSPDGDPDPFNFVGIDGVMPRVTVTSAPVTITGIDISLPIGAENGDLDIGCDGEIDVSHSNDPLYVVADTSVCLRHVSAAYCGATITTTLHVGSVSSPFTTTTRTVADGCVNPDSDGAGTVSPIMFLLYLSLLGRRMMIRLRLLKSNEGA